MAAALGFAVGGIAGGVGVRYLNRFPEQGDERGSLEWALSMRDVSEAELLAAAGDLERVSARYRAETRLVPCFERLLDVALWTDDPAADAAAACAIRSLVRLGRPELALDRAADAAVRPDLSQTAAALEHAARRSRSR